MLNNPESWQFYSKVDMCFEAQQILSTFNMCKSFIICLAMDYLCLLVLFSPTISKSYIKVIYNLIYLTI